MCVCVRVTVRATVRVTVRVCVRTCVCVCVKSPYIHNAYTNTIIVFVEKEQL